MQTNHKIYKSVSESGSQSVSAIGILSMTENRYPIAIPDTDPDSDSDSDMLESGTNASSYFSPNALVVASYS